MAEIRSLFEMKQHQLTGTKEKLECILNYVNELIKQEAPVSSNTVVQFENGISDLFEEFERGVVDDCIKDYEKCTRSSLF